MFNRVILISFMVIVHSCLVFAQIEDCVGEILVCSNQTINSNPQGIGIDDFANPNNDSGCLGTQERTSEWYRITIRDDAPPGGLELGMTINPVGGTGEDYDFAVFGPNLECDSLSAPIRCSYAGSLCAFCPLTGMGMGELPGEEADADNDGFTNPIFVLPGESYFILIDNFSMTSLGFGLDWTGDGSDHLSCECQVEVVLPMDTTYCESGQSYQVNTQVTNVLGASSDHWRAVSGDVDFISDTTIRNPTIQFPLGFSGIVEYEYCIRDDAGFAICWECDTIQITVATDPNVMAAIQDTLCLDQNYTPTVNVSGGTWVGDIDPSGQIITSVLGIGDFTSEYIIQEFTCEYRDTLNYTIIDEPSFSHNLRDTIYCPNNAIFDYSIFNMQFVERFTWSFPSDVIVVSGGVNQVGITLDWSASIGGQLCLDVENDCKTTQNCVNYTVIPDPNTPDMINGEIDLCGFLGDTLTYFIDNIESGIIYNWRLSPEATVVDQSQNGQISVVWNGSMFDAQVCITAQNDCVISPEFCLDVTGRDLTINYDVVQPFCPDELLGSLFISGVDGGQRPYTYALDSVPIDDGIFYIKNLQPGEHILEVTDALGCIGSSTFIVDFYPETNMAIDDLNLDFRETRSVDILTNIDRDSIDRVIWTPANLALCQNDPCTTVLIEGIETRTMTVELFTKAGCSTLVQFLITVNKTQEVFFPNAFTPNGDTRNDLYIVQGDQGVDRILSLDIFDRWGSLMYQAKDLLPNDTSRGWDGYFENIESPVAVYMYQSAVLFVDGTIKEFSGDFTLIR